MAEKLLKGGESSGQLLMLGQDHFVLLLQFVDIVGGFGENRALMSFVSSRPTMR